MIRYINPTSFYTSIDGLCVFLQRISKLSIFEQHISLVLEPGQWRRKGSTWGVQITALSSPTGDGRTAGLRLILVLAGWKGAIDCRALPLDFL